ncbi:MAG: MtnX-like HAD-IB family phosphatase [Mizugakiibacter sp.]|uniref:MtnX-like HAD-IB family phosphatase n=1 Tax=Mizugakiibacter sp. TaxID=1972610 RepID=UPI0031BFDF34|nr:MtnX-like HAD-IB family phosphatase [Xanthomonadaceae bacterium]
MSPWTILCDFDGTIAVEDITDALLERYARPEWEELERAWRAGRIGSRECMAGQVALLDMSRAELDAQLGEMRIDPAFPAFVAAATRASLPVRVVSDGLDYAIRAILARHGLDALPIQANRLIATGARSWRLEFPYADADCRKASGMCKCAGAVRAHNTHRRVLLIGDGASDFCAAGEADLVFAKHRLIEHCRHAGIPHVPIVGFADALELLPALAAGTLSADCLPPLPQDAAHHA